MERDFSEERTARYAELAKKHGPGPLPLLEKVEALEHALAAERAANTANIAELHRADALVGELRAGIESMVRDGLDIDDPKTHPGWTGKIRCRDGEWRMLYELEEKAGTTAKEPF
jgi:hypothetical protein